MSHTINAAMERGELTEEEAYFILRFAGHYGYNKSIKRIEGKPLWKRVLNWFIWCGGWSHPKISQWDRGAKAFEPFKRDYKGKLKIQDPTPLSIAGHRVTFFGTWTDIKIKRGVIWVIHHDFRRGEYYAYWSNDGTPPREEKEARGHRGRYFFRFQNKKIKQKLGHS